MKFPLAYNSWLPFGVTTLSLALLSYETFNGGIVLGILLLGVVLPFLWAVKTAPLLAASRTSWFQEELAPCPGTWIFYLIAAAGIFVRLYQLTTLTTWPCFDEGVDSFFSMELLKKGDLKFFYHFSQVPFLFNWLLAAFYSVFPPSLFSLWLYPALISIFTLLLTLAASRLYFSRGFSLVLSTLLAFGFWHLLIGRCCMPMVLMVFWEVLALAAAAFFFSRPEGPSRQRAAWVWGWVVGTGLFVYPSWPLVALFIFGALYWNRVRRGGLAGGVLMRFFLPVAACSVIFILMAFHDHFGGYIRGLWALNGGFQWRRQLSDGFCYLSTVFFQPGPGWTNWFVWGGVFNPLAGSLFLVGLLELLRLKKNLLAQWLMAALLLSLLPGFAAKDVEIYRIITLFPLMAIVGAFGAMALLRDSPRKWRTLGLSLLLLASSGLDLYHLYGPYHEVFGVPNPQWALQKSEPFYRAFQILDENFKPQGPGAVLTDLWAHSSDESLTLATYPFNTVRNPRLSPPDAKWVAVLTDPNEKPFLARRFPHGKWFWLGTLKANDPDGLMMGVIPLEDSNREALSHWIEADKELQPVTSFVMNRAPWASKQGAIDLLEAAYPSVQGDPFLESSYWEKTYRMEETDDHPQAMLKALQEGLKRGYPSAHLYNEEGILLEGLNRIPEARSAFEQALKAPINLTLASQNLGNIGKP